MKPDDERRDLAVVECDAHDTGPIIWPGTAHQHVVCVKCKRRLPV